jgi:AraC-like DNA-binding protein
MELSYIRKGKGLYEIENKSYQVVEGDIVIVNNIEKHRVTYQEDDVLYETVIHFSPDFIWSRDNGSFDYNYLSLFMYDGKKFNNKPRLDIVSSLLVKDMISEIIDEYTLKKPYYELIIKAKLLMIIAMILRQFKANCVDDDALAKKVRNIQRLEKIINYINENYYNDLSLNRVAGEFFMNASYFSEYFKKNIGISFNEYVGRVRITKSIEMMEDGSKKISTVAFDVGFNSLASFYSTFKKITGFTPGEYNWKYRVQ